MDKRDLRNVTSVEELSKMTVEDLLTVSGCTLCTQTCGTTTHIEEE
ncbi:hypothetical protein P9027_26590 [Bacillus thuringiensis]|nr:hypothetical protein [Bacillus thuringiensis]MEC2713400.1 hypothetical protein [Bacillus cereus]MEC2744689.1 hypothetical protein [Bacillus cereus]MEC2757869.1 hypothetical protein [Bacillus cereus]MEC2830240.1 hypothetical protein [Bacillus cereus]MEC3225522.1 hypothetical protein [Bacillus thuringiensis]